MTQSLKTLTKERGWSPALFPWNNNVTSTAWWVARLGLVSYRQNWGGPNWVKVTSARSAQGLLGSKNSPATEWKAMSEGHQWPKPQGSSILPFSTSHFPFQSGICFYCNPHYSILKHTFHVTLMQQTISFVRVRPKSIVPSVESQMSVEWMMSESSPGWTHRKTVSCTNKEDIKSPGWDQPAQKDNLAWCWYSGQMSGSFMWILTLLPYLAVWIPGLWTLAGHSKLVWSPGLCSYELLQLSIRRWYAPARQMCTYWFTVI